MFERYQRSEKALVGALSEVYVQGVSTRKVKAINKRLSVAPREFAARRLVEAFATGDVVRTPFVLPTSATGGNHLGNLEVNGIKALSARHEAAKYPSSRAVRSCQNA